MARRRMHTSTTHGPTTVSDSSRIAPVDQPQIQATRICRSDLGCFLLQPFGVALSVDDEPVVGGLADLLDLVFDDHVKRDTSPVDLPHGGRRLDPHPPGGGGEMADVDPDAHAVLARTEIGPHRL